MRDLDPHEINTLIRISCCVALHRDSDLRQEFVIAMEHGLDLRLIREAVLQTYLFAGYAATINAFLSLNDVLGAMNRTPTNDEFWSEEQVAGFQERGEDLCQKIYGSQYEKLVHNMKQLHPDLAAWMITEGYGKVLGRPFISASIRELLIVAMTAVLQVERQFYSHVRGALNVGATPDQLRATLKQVQSYLPGDAARRFSSILGELLADR